MTTHITGDIALFGLVLENTYLDLHGNQMYADQYGTHAEWTDAVDRTEQAEWWLDEFQRMFAGLNCCQHGLSAQACYGPSHYAQDFY